MALVALRDLADACADARRAAVYSTRRSRMQVVIGKRLRRFLSLPGLPWYGQALIGFYAIALVAVYDYAWESTRIKVLAWALMGAAGAALLFSIRRTVARETLARRMAANLYAHWRRMFSGPHEYCCMDSATLDPLEREYFASVQPWFESQRFHHVADLQNVTINQIWPAQRQVHRILLNEDGSLRVTLDRVLVLNEGVAPQCGTARVRVTTEFNNGRFVISSNSSEDLVDDGPIVEIEWRLMPPDCSFHELLEAHREHIQAEMKIKPGLRPISLRSSEEVIASLNRMQLELSKHVRAFDCSEYLRETRICNRRDAKLLSLVAAEVARLQRCERCGYNLLGSTMGVCPECAARTSEWSQADETHH